MELDFQYNSGGRENYFKKERVGDCVCRAIAIANDMDYLEVYNMINEYAKKEHITKRKKKKSSARNGVFKGTEKKILEKLGWSWVATMEIGKGCQVHLRANEIPMNKTIIVQVSRHLTCVKSGVINDTYDCSKDGNRCVYGYWVKNEITQENKNVGKKLNEITIDDIKDYIKELKIAKEVLESQMYKNEMMIDWYNKRIEYFESRL